MRALLLGGLLVLVLGLVLAGCAGRPCAELPAQQAERDGARRAYAELVRSGAPAEVTGPADAELHELERRVAAFEAGCASR